MSVSQQFVLAFSIMFLMFCFYELVEVGLRATWNRLRRLLDVTWAMLSGLVHRPKAVAAPEPQAAGPLHHYYKANDLITKAVTDTTVPTVEIIRTVESVLDDEFRVSESYRAKPELLYEGHPWITFVRTGDAGYLGWEKDYVPGPSPVERRRLQRRTYVRPDGRAITYAVEDRRTDRRECGFMGCGSPECEPVCKDARRPMTALSDQFDFLRQSIQGELTSADQASNVVPLVVPADDRVRYEGCPCDYCGQPPHAYEGTHTYQAPEREVIEIRTADGNTIQRFIQ